MMQWVFRSVSCLSFFFHADGLFLFFRDRPSGALSVYACSRGGMRGREGERSGGGRVVEEGEGWGLRETPCPLG